MLLFDKFVVFPFIYEQDCSSGGILFNSKKKKKTTTRDQGTEKIRTRFETQIYTMQLDYILIMQLIMDVKNSWKCNAKYIYCSFPFRKYASAENFKYIRQRERPLF